MFAGAIFFPTITGISAGYCCLPFGGVDVLLQVCMTTLRTDLVSLFIVLPLYVLVRRGLTLAETVGHQNLYILSFVLAVEFLQYMQEVMSL